VCGNGTRRGETTWTAKNRVFPALGSGPRRAGGAHRIGLGRPGPLVNPNNRRARGSILNVLADRKNGHARRFFRGGRASRTDSGRSYPPGVEPKYRKRRSPGDRTTGATAACYPPHGSHARAKAPHKAAGFSLSLQHPTPAGPATLRKEVPRTGAVNEARTASPIHTPPLFLRFPPARPRAHAFCQPSATLQKTPVEGGWVFRTDRTSRAAPARPVGGVRPPRRTPGRLSLRTPGPAAAIRTSPAAQAAAGPTHRHPERTEKFLPTRRQGVVL
jgi:hypothetical protein